MGASFVMYRYMQPAATRMARYTCYGCMCVCLAVPRPVCAFMLVCVCVCVHVGGLWVHGVCMYIYESVYTFALVAMIACVYTSVWHVVLGGAMFMFTLPIDSS